MHLVGSIKRNIDCDIEIFDFIFFNCPITLHFTSNFKCIFMTQAWQMAAAFYSNNSQSPILHRLCVGWISRNVSDTDRPNSRSSLRLCLRNEGASGRAQQPANLHAAFFMIQPVTYWTHKIFWKLDLTVETWCLSRKKKKAPHIFVIPYAGT